MALLNSTQQEHYQGGDYDNYQFVSLKDIINQFMVVYVGEDKIISKAKRLDVAFHAQRALAELSFDTFKSCKAQEILVPASLQMILPHDYVNYTKISFVDSLGIKHLLYPASKTSNPSSIVQDTDGLYSPIVSAFSQYVTTDQTNITYGTGIANDTVNNQVDFSSAALNTTLSWGNIPFEVGRSYTLTYTISNVPYVDPSLLNGAGGAIVPKVTDAYGNEGLFSAQSQDGTYTQTIALTTSVIASQVFNSLIFEVNGLNAFTGSISDITLTESTDLPLNLESTAWNSYKSGKNHEVSHNASHHHDDHEHEMLNSRYGLDPQHAQANGSFYIDCVSGKIHFSSNIAGKTVILDYISDSLGTDGEMQVHKFAEEAMYKWISHAILSGKANVPEHQVLRFKKERFAAIRTAKLRLSNFKLEELTQILRGKSKQIKH